MWILWSPSSHRFDSRRIQYTVNKRNKWYIHDVFKTRIGTWYLQHGCNFAEDGVLVISNCCPWTDLKRQGKTGKQLKEKKRNNTFHLVEIVNHSFEQVSISIQLDVHCVHCECMGSLTARAPVHSITSLGYTVQLLYFSRTT
jgi:hypothetical protein